MCNILLHSEPVLRHSDNRVPGHHQREVSKYYNMYNKIVTNSVKILEQNIVRVWRVACGRIVATLNNGARPALVNGTAVQSHLLILYVNTNKCINKS